MRRVVGIVVLAAWGAILLATAHPVHPMQTTGVVAEAADVFAGNTYEDTRITLRSDGRNYHVYLPGLHPPLPRDHLQTGQSITLWFDPDIDWVNVTQTWVLALSLPEEGADRAAHRLDDFDKPEWQAVRQRLVGAGVLGLVAVFVGLWALFKRLSEPRSADGPDSLATHRPAGE